MPEAHVQRSFNHKAVRKSFPRGAELRWALDHSAEKEASIANWGPLGWPCVRGREGCGPERERSHFTPFKPAVFTKWSLCVCVLCAYVCACVSVCKSVCEPEYMWLHVSVCLWGGGKGDKKGDWPGIYFLKKEIFDRHTAFMQIYFSCLHSAKPAPLHPVGKWRDGL